MKNVKHSSKKDALKERASAELASHPKQLAVLSTTFFST
jgi:hypothetical protein